MGKYSIDNRPGPIDFECNNDVLMRTLQNVKNLLMCRKGEIPYDRRRGLDPALFDLGIPEMNRVLLPEIDRVLGWEPDAEAVHAEAAMDVNGNTIISCVVEINL